jgi:hypothetical protein
MEIFVESKVFGFSRLIVDQIVAFFSLRVSNAHFYALKGSESPAEPELAQLVHTGGKCTRM